MSQQTIVLTQIQGAYYWAIRRFYEENDQIPPCHYLSAAVGAVSANASYEVMERLCVKGILERNEIGNYKRGAEFYNVANDYAKPAGGAVNSPIAKAFI